MQQSVALAAVAVVSDRITFKVFILETYSIRWLNKKALSKGTAYPCSSKDLPMLLPEGISLLLP